MINKFTRFFKTIASEKKPHLGEKKLLKKIKNGFKNNEFKMYIQFIVDNKLKKIVSAKPFQDGKILPMKFCCPEHISV